MQPKQPTEINLCRRTLFDLSILNSYNVSNCTHIDLSNNCLMHLDQLRTYHYHKLKSLCLAINVIVSIAGIAKCDMPELEVLQLYGNQISDISALVTLKAPKLLQIRLGYRRQGNILKNVQKLSECKFPNLQELTVDYCEITNVRFLKQANFQHLSLIYLTGNNIESIQKTQFDQFIHLKSLSIRQNQLTKVRFLQRLNLTNLSYLNISDNFITQIRQISQCCSPLQRIFLNDNLIHNFYPVVKSNWEEIEQLQFYNIKNIYSKKLLKVLDRKSMIKKI